MDMFSWLPTGQFDNVDIEFPTTANELSNGLQPLKGYLKQLFEVSAVDIKRYSKALTKDIRIQCVRLDPNMTAAIGTAVKGRPVFWSDKSKGYVTTDATTASQFAGTLLNTITAKGNITFIFVAGNGPALFAGSITNGAPAVNMHITLAISGGVAAFDVLADATAMTMAIFNQVQNVQGKLSAVPTAGAVSEVLLRENRGMNDGIV